MRVPPPCATIVAVVAALVLTPALASASPLWDPTLGRAVFTGPTAPHSSAPLVNPASLKLAPEGLHFYAAASGTLDQYSIDRRLVDPDTGVESAGPSTSAQTWEYGLAGTGYWVTREFTFALLLDLPPGEAFIADQDALGYHSLGGRHSQWRGGVSASYQIASWLIIGTTLRAAKSRVTLRFARDTALDGGRGVDGIGADCAGAPCGFENPEAAERYDVNVKSPKLLSAENTALTAGVMIRLASAWWLGLAYDSPQGFLSSVDLTGSVAVDAAPRAGGAHLSGNATVGMYLPQSFLVGARGRVLPGWDVVVGGRYQDLSTMQQYDLRTYGGDLASGGVPEWIPRPRGFHDVIALDAGMEQVDTGERFVFGARVGVETSAVAANRLSALQPYGTMFTADVGAQVRIAPWLVFQANYGIAWAPRVDSGDSAYDPIDRLDCVESNFDYNTPVCAAVRSGYAGPTAAGSYHHLGHAVRVGFRIDAL